MAQRAVVDYKVFWNLPGNAPRLDVKLEGARWSRVPLDSFSEFMALLALLQGPKAVFFDVQAQTFSTV